ncbi:2,3-dihydroxybenzoate-AMP ligase [Pseudoalteromonas sp. CIP111854]|uniref:2,3-dihydroxybenzoate-AMP ligase n=1 Tax=Pseudoalteromonas holothuriae TaxID=2963714 RepID=A0A9W4VMZ5_9GAMM|nr:AMP-binding protein [Pseudoalteromonas sp. CIP111854]CAH9051221.1 2,3-dihydroxybenzoate-AMP ligase [Pseudoalteromonas sp. CIP111854]
MSRDFLLDPELTPWPQTRVDQYISKGVWGEQTLWQWIAEKLTDYGNQTVLSGVSSCNSGEISLSGLALLKNVHFCAVNLQAKGLSKGDKVIVQMANNNEFVVLLFALLYIGVIPVMALPGHGRTEISAFAELTEAKAWFVNDKATSFDVEKLGVDLQVQLPILQVFVEDVAYTQHINLSELFAPSADHAFIEPATVDCGSIALLLCSGGTTGIPKLIPRTHRDYIYNAQASADAANLNSSDVYLVALPSAHNFPLACPGILGALCAKAHIVMAALGAPDIAFAYIDKYQVTVSALVPSLVNAWLEYAQVAVPPGASLRFLQVGGAKLDERIARRIPKELGCELQQVFGMAEGLLNFTQSQDPQVLKYKTQGRPLSEFDEVKVIDEHGNAVAPGQTGQLLTRGPYTLRGYYRNRAANKAAFTADGFYQTGDLVRQLRTGHLMVVGRIKEVVRRAGEAVAVETLEALLVEHESIQDIAVVGLPCKLLGEKTCAAIVLSKGAPQGIELSEIRQYLTEQGVARHMLPDTMSYVTSIPMTAIGKISRKKLAQEIQTKQS